MTWEDVVRLAQALPEIEEDTSYGTPAIRIKGKLLARLRDDGATLVLRVDFEERLALTHSQPDIFFVTKHYEDWPFVLVRLAKADPDEVGELLFEAWLDRAPKRLAAAFEHQRAETRQT
jgi:hypothetical protein